MLELMVIYDMTINGYDSNSKKDIEEYWKVRLS